MNNRGTSATSNIPAWQLYGEKSPFPDLLHIERIVDRAAGLDWQIAPHRHVHLHQVFAVLSGQVMLGLDGTRHSPTPAALINIPRGSVHSFAFSAGTEGYVLTLPATDFPELLAPQADILRPLSQAFVAPLPPGMAQDMAALAALHGSAPPHRRLRLRAAAVALCCAVADAANAAISAAAPADARIERFQALIRNHLAQGWQLADYARTLGLSDRHLRRLCLQATGMSAHTLIETTRLREACRLLAYTQMQVQQVGFALGYDDSAYFTRVFRRAMGISPAAYRQRLER